MKYSDFLIMDSSTMAAMEGPGWDKTREFAREAWKKSSGKTKRRIVAAGVITAAVLYLKIRNKIKAIIHGNSQKQKMIKWFDDTYLPKIKPVQTQMAKEMESEVNRIINSNPDFKKLGFPVKSFSDGDIDWFPPFKGYNQYGTDLVFIDYNYDPYTSDGIEKDDDYDKREMEIATKLCDALEANENKFASIVKKYEKKYQEILPAKDSTGVRINFIFGEMFIDDKFAELQYQVHNVEVWETYWKAHPNEDRTKFDEKMKKYGE